MADYLDMLSAELRGDAYSKSEHRRSLQPLLDGRTEGAIERKHGNISAILIELGFPYISGYKPYRNYQRLLWDVVAERIGADTALDQLASRAVEAPPSVPAVDDILRSWVDVPRAGRQSAVVRERAGSVAGAPRRGRVDYLAREARNRLLGNAGELFALRYEQARLSGAGKEALAARVEHVARTQGDGAGYDILSYEENGREKLIEVKTTRFGAQTPFFVTRNELAVSKTEEDHYHLYRIFDFEKAPRFFAVGGSLSLNFQLEPREYLATLI